MSNGRTMMARLERARGILRDLDRVIHEITGARERVEEMRQATGGGVALSLTWTEQRLGEATGTLESARRWLLDALHDNTPELWAPNDVIHIVDVEFGEADDA